MRDLGLPMPPEVDVHVCDTRAAFHRGLSDQAYVGVAQFALAGGDGRSDQWLAEGVAERVAFEVLERLNLDALAERRTRALAAARRHPGCAAGRLDLVALGSPREFTLRHQREPAER